MSSDVIMITERDIYQLFATCPSSTSADILKKVAELCALPVLSEVSAAEVLRCRKRFNSTKKRKYTDKHISVDFDELVQCGSKDVALINTENDASSAVSPEPKKKIKKSLDRVNRTQKNRRTDAIWAQVKQAADEEDIDVSVLLGLLLTRCDD